MCHSKTCLAYVMVPGCDVVIEQKASSTLRSFDLCCLALLCPDYQVEARLYLALLCLGLSYFTMTWLLRGSQTKPSFALPCITLPFHAWAISD